MSSKFNLFIRLWKCIGHKKKKSFVFLIFLSLIASLSELISIGLVLPFLSVLANPEYLIKNKVFNYIYENFFYFGTEKILLFFSILFGLSVLVSGFLRLFLIWFSTKFSYSLGSDLSCRVYELTLHQPYSFHINKNSSEIISTMSSKANNIISQIIMPFANLISYFTLMVFMLIALAMVNLEATILSALLFASFYFFVAYLTNKKLQFNSHVMASSLNDSIKSIQEGLGSIRDVLIDGTQSIYCDIYKKTDIKLRGAQASSVFIGSSPRLVIESFGTIFIIIIAYRLSMLDKSFSSAIPILGTLAIGAQKILPVLQQLYISWTNIQSGINTLDDVLLLLEQPEPKFFKKQSKLKPLLFNNFIELKKVIFAYAGNSPVVLDRIDLIIKKGSRIGIIGKTGCGKSTLVDLIMALLLPKSGEMFIDSQKINESNAYKWQKNISHVPQNIYIADATIKENIALGFPIESIDANLIKNVIKQAQLSDLVSRLSHGLDTNIGERGIKLSGGERQRIGIARALYRKPRLIIFDEATSALDSVTENSVMSAINKLSSDLTILIVAHRIGTLKNCDQIIELKDGKIFKKYNYAQLTKGLKERQ